MNKNLFEYQKDLQKADHWITIISVEKTGTNFKSAPAYLEDIYLNYL